jgi:hypothetical protein
MKNNKSKEVKIVGLQVSKDFGGLKATELKFDEKNRLTVVKGEVGAGKTTLNKAMRLTTQGSGVLTDKNLYGDIDVTTQLSDGDMSIFVGCRTDKHQNLSYFLYRIDKDGKKVKDVVLDGKRATPASYLKSLQTALTWRLDELTSENPTTTRNILLELYSSELESKGVIFDKKNHKYTDSIIHKIEKAKNHRSHMDMKRKEVGGIADDMTKKGINFETRRELKKIDELEKVAAKIKSKINFAETNLEQAKENKLNKLKLEAAEVVSDIKDLNATIIEQNKKIDSREKNLSEANFYIDALIGDLNRRKFVKETLIKNLPDLGEKSPEVKFDIRNKITSKPKKFKDSGVIYDALLRYKDIQKKYKKVSKSKDEADTKDLELQLIEAQKAVDNAKSINKEIEAVNAFHDWQDANDKVNEIKKDYYFKLTEIDTGVKGLFICTDQKNEEDENIYLMYDGRYDKKYFNNPDRELRKLSSYSGTQKPMICLLIQNYLLGKKTKTLPYLWIDDVPIDKKTRALLEKMAKELGLWLFVNWTGDFKAKQLKNGEILLENGEILMNQ